MTEDNNVELWRLTLSMFGLPDKFHKTRISRRQFSNLAFKWGSVLFLGGAFFDDEWLTVFDKPHAIDDNRASRWVYSTCCFCGVGCGVWVGVNQGQVRAVKGMSDHPVNKGFLCVKGIYQYQTVHSRNRGTTPLIRNNNNEFVSTGWEDTLDIISKKFSDIISSNGPDALAIYHGSQLLQEEYYVISKLASGCIGTKNIDVNSRLCSLSAIKGYQFSLGESVSPTNYEDIEKADCIIIVGHNPAENHPVLFYRLKQAKKENNPTIFLVDPRRTPTANISDYHLPLKSGTDAVLLCSIINVIITAKLIDPDFIERHTINYDSLAKSVKDYTPHKAAKITKIPANTIRKIALKYGHAKSAMIIWSVGVNHNIDGTRVANLINNLCLITGNIGRAGTGPFFMAGQVSSAGSTGSITTLPGGRDYDDEKDREDLAELWQVPLERIPSEEGILTTDIWEGLDEGRIKALWIIGTNPLLSVPNLNSFQSALEKLELLIVQDCYHDTSTAKHADVFFPAAMWSEKTGTVVNSERRVNLIKKAVDPPGRSLSDWEIIVLLANKMGYSELFDYRSSEEIFDEWREVSKGTKKDMSGITYEKIQAQKGVPYPSKDLQDKGTSRLYTDLVFPTPDGKARLIPADEDYGPAEKTDEEYPFHLLTGRILQLWMTNTKTRLSPDLMSNIEDPIMEISPEDARSLEINNYDNVALISRRGRIKVKAGITDRILPGHVFAHFHYKETPVNLLTTNKVDPYSKQPAIKSAAVKIEKLTKD